MASAVLASLFLVAGAASRPPVPLPRLAAAPVIDCRLDDDAWGQAAVLDGFVQTRPGTNTPPSRATEVRLGYTPAALYVGIRAADDPSRVRATLAKRDAILEDDTVALYLDTFHDRRRAYLVMVNPVGVQQDGVFVEGQAPDWSVDLVLESRGCLTDAGYTVEMAIPFESLRYEAGPGRDWGLHVLREVKHLDEEASWMPLRRDRVGVGASNNEVRARFLSQAGVLTGLDGLPGSRILELTPVGTLSRTSRVGLSAKATLTSSLAADLAVNPDFAEVEADQPQLTANQRFPLFFEEKRPFFLEGAEMLRTPVQAFHSRTIVDPSGALRLTGRRGRTSLAALASAGELRAGVLRLRRDAGDRSSLGLISSASSFVDRENLVAGLDAKLGLSPSVDLTVQALGTVSDRAFFDPDSGESPHRRGYGFGYLAELAKTSDRITLQLSGQGFSPDYRADLGFTQRTDTNRWSATARYNAPPREQGALVSWSVVQTTLAQFDWQGRLQYAYVYPRLLLSLRRQTFVNLAAYHDYLRVFEEEFGPRRTATRAGAFAGPSAERSTRYHGASLQAGTAPSRAWSLNAGLDFSWNNMDYDLGAGPRFPRVSPGALLDPSAPLDPGPADSRFASAGVVYQPAEALRLSVSYERQQLRRQDTGRLVFDQHLVSLRGQYALTRFAWVRARFDHDSLDGRLLAQLHVGWTPRPGTAVYAGYDETGLADQRRNRTAFLKLSWSGRFRL
jgi:hypothetical protein